MTDLTTLIAKLEAATGPDRELDVAISCDIDGCVLEKRGNDRKEWLYPVEGDGGRQDPSAYGQFLSPRFTSSIDDAVALAERVLPGFVFDYIGQDYISVDNGYKATGWIVEVVNGKRFQGQAQSLPIAIVIAILRAKQAEDKP